MPLLNDNDNKRDAMLLLNDDDMKTEKIDGVIYNMSPSGGFMHSQINGNIYHALRSQLKNSVCSVSMENLDLYVSDNEYMIPDIMLFCDRKRVIHDKYKGVPRFVVETLSPATAYKDRIVKMKKYASLGIDEYWIISPKEQSVELYYLENNAYQLTASYIFQEDKADKAYNADTVLALRAMPAVTLTLQEIFEI